MDKFKVSTVVAIYSENFNKQPLVTKLGKPYKTAKVKFGTDDRIIKIFKWDAKDVVVGDEFEGKIIEKEFNGKKWFELETPKKGADLEVIKTSVARLEFRMDQLENAVKIIAKNLPSKVSGTDIDYPEMEGDPTF